MKPFPGFVQSPLLSAREFARLPALHFFILLACGVLAYDSGMLTPALMLALGAAVLLAVAAGRFLPVLTLRPSSYALLAACLFLLGGAAGLVDTARRPAPSPALTALFHHRVPITGRVVEVEGDRQRHGTMIIEAWGRRPTEESDDRLGRVRIGLFRDIGEVLPGDSVRIFSRLRPPGGRRNPNDFDFAEFLSRRGILGYMNAGSWDSLTVVGQVGGGWRRTAAAARYKLIGRIRGNLPEVPAGLLIGLLLGEVEFLTSATVGSVTASGLRHILAVSGLHLGILAGLFFLLLRLLGVDRRRQLWLVLAVTFLYLLLVGLRPSVVRAWLMLAAILLGFVLEREPRPINSLAACASLLVLVSPWYLRDLGFQLSFSATFFIIYALSFHRRVGRGGRPGFRLLADRLLVIPLLVSLGAFIGTAPILAWYFGRIYPVSIPLNLLVVPLVGTAMGTGIASLAVGWFPGIGPLLWWIGGLILKSIVAVTGWIAGLKLTLVTGRPEALVVLLALVLGLLIPAALRRRPQRIVLACFLLLWGVLWFGFYRPGLKPSGLTVTFLDIGEADAALIRTPSGAHWLVDAGPSMGDYDAGLQVVAPVLWNMGISRLDGLVLTHPHRDHVGGAESVASLFSTDRIVLSHIFKFPQVTREPYIPPSSWRGRTQYPSSGDTVINDAGLTARVVYSRPLTPTGAGKVSNSFVNNCSLVLRLTYGEVAFLLTGDLERRGERAVIESGLEIGSDVLKVGHHGSPTSSGADFLEAVTPRLAVVSCSRYGRGRPSKYVVDRLDRVGCQVFRTSLDGAVVVRTDGRTLEVETIASERKLKYTQENLDLNRQSR